MSQVFLQLVVAIIGLMDLREIETTIARNKVLGTALRMSAERYEY